MAAHLSMTTETSNARGEWVLVPRVPTEAMIDAWRDAPDRWVEAYAAMLLAAPPPAAARGDVRIIARDIHYAIMDDGLAPLSNADNHKVREAILRVLQAALAAEGVQAGEVEQRGASVPVSEQAVSDVAWHIGKSIDYIDHHYPGTKHLDAGPILRNMRRWHQRLTAALTEARNVR